MKNAEIIVKILKKGDKVSSIYPMDNAFCITVLQKSGEAYVCSVIRDEKGLPRLEQPLPIKVTFGDFEIESKVLGADGNNIDITTC
jgi:hypothetical protein